MTHRSAVLLLFAAAICWSLGGVLIKSVEWPSMAKAGARSLVACVVLWAWLRRPQFSLRPAQWAAAVAYAFTVCSFVIATDRTTAANAIFLQYTAPIYVAVLGHYVLGERTRRSDWIFIAIALAGIALFFRDQFSARGLTGMLVALASGMSFSVLVILLRKESNSSPGTAVLMGNILTALVGLPFAVGQPLSVSQAAGIATMGIVQLGLPYILYSIAIRRVTALESILIPMIEPVLNPLWVALTRGEIPGTWSLLGGALVLGSVILREVARRTDWKEGAPGG
jgi:drug/metabolite transporter (DMT)-like permease